MEYYIVDVFAEKKYSGNQLAVVKLTKSISDIEMQKIANEFHFSETTFILSNHIKDNYEYNVRIFTPQSEVPFAGHPTLGTAFVIRNEIIKENIEEVILKLKVGRIPVTFKYNDNEEILWMKQIEPEFGNIYDITDISKMINIQENDIDNKYPIQEISTGMPFIIIPLKNLKAVRKASTNIPLYKSFLNVNTQKPLFIFSSETYNKNNHINCRMFADLFGIPEDPATGSANGCLAAYLVKYKYFKTNKINIKVEQGYEIGRESLLYLQAEKNNNKFNIHVGGKAIKIAKGTLL